MNHFRIRPIQMHDIQHWFSMPDDELERANARWVTASESPGYPCRVSLQDAQPGERVLLFPFAHLDVATPYRGIGPVYVRDGATPIALGVDECPPVFSNRLLSFRAYCSRGLLRWACTADGPQAAETIHALLKNPKVHQVQIHYAAPGCYSCAAHRDRD